MRTATAEAPLVLSCKSIDSMRANPVAAAPLPPALLFIAEEVPIRSRTEMLATLLEREIGSGNASDLVCQIWRGARALDRAALRCLISLLEVRLSGVELLRRAIVPVQLMRACQRAARGAPAASRAGWRELLEETRAAAARVGAAPDSLHRPETRAALQRRAHALLELLLAARISPAELAWLTGFAELELRATSLRLGDLAAKVGACDSRRISQLLPILSKEEERIRDTRSLLVRLPAPEELVKRAPVLLTRLEDRGFDALVREIGARPEGLEVARALVLTSWRAPLASELAFMGGLVRLLADRQRDREKPPLDPARALLLALMSRRSEGMVLELTPNEIRTTTGLWEALEVEPRSGGFTLAFDARRYEPMLPEDGVPELTYPAVRRAPDMRVLVLANLQNEHVLGALLGLPRVANSPGLVEMVATRSRSLKILLEIANRRELYSGVANRNVPKALLWHPSNIPVSALRKFVHVRFVERGELAVICRRGSRARPEVRQMVASYLASLSTT